MKRFLTFVLTIALSCMVLPAHATQKAPESVDNPLVGAGPNARTLNDLLHAGDYTQGRVIARVTNEFAPIATYSNDAAWSIESLYTYAPDSSTAAVRSRAAPTDRVVLIESSKLSTEELLRNLADAPGVVLAEPDYVRQFEDPTLASDAEFDSESVAELEADLAATPRVQATTDDPLLNQQWHLSSTTTAAGATNARELWNQKGIPGNEDDLEEVVVAVLDTGVDYTHPDLAQSMWVNPDTTKVPGTHGFDLADNDPDPMDDALHGTHVAGIIAASMNNAVGGAGVAPNAKIMALRIGTETFSYSAIIAAYDYIKRAIEINSVRVVAVNNSWGSEDSSTVLGGVMEDLYQSHGVMTICASGNSADNVDLHLYLPAGFSTDSIISVNAVYQDGGLALFSNFGAMSTDICAPGMGIISTVPKKEGSLFTGTDDTLVLKDGFERDGELFSYATQGVAPANVERTDEDWSGSKPGGSVRWTIDQAQAGQVAELVFRADSDVVNAALAGSKRLEDIQHFTFSFKVADAAQPAQKRMARIFLSSVDDDNPWVEITPSLGTSIPSGTWRTLRLSPPEKRRNLIDWDNLAIKISYAVTDFDEGNKVEIGIDNIRMFESGPYKSTQGTSMAAPMVTGAYALIAGLFPDEDAAMWRARILGGVSRTGALSGTCTSDGSLDLVRAANNPLPVVDALEVAQDGSLSAVVRGSWFGDSPGRALLDGKDLEVVSWSSHEVSVKLPAALESKQRYIQVERADGETGRRCVLLSTGEEQASYEHLPVPSLEELGLAAIGQGSEWRLQPAGGKLYASSTGLQRKSDGTNFRGLLVFDPQSKTWSVDETLASVVGSDFLLASYDDVLYVLESKPARVYRYDPATQTVSSPVDCDAALSALGYESSFVLGSSLACDGRSLWITGSTKESLSDVSPTTRVDIQTGQVTSFAPLTEARRGPASCFANGQLVVAAGKMKANLGITEGFASSFERLQGDIWVTAKFPFNIADNQSGSVALATLPAGATIGGVSTPYERLLLAGLTTADLSGSDTYVYDPVADTWQTIPERLSASKMAHFGSAVLDDAFYVLGQDTMTHQTVFRRLNFEGAPDDKQEGEKPGQEGGEVPGQEGGSVPGQEESNGSGTSEEDGALSDPGSLAPTGDGITGAAFALCLTALAAGVVCVSARQRRNQRACR